MTEPHKSHLSDSCCAPVRAYTEDQQPRWGGNDSRVSVTCLALLSCSFLVTPAGISCSLRPRGRGCP